METPIADFVRAYAAKGTVRAHMPGHKGVGELGCEALDITEVKGADALYEAEGIIAKSEKNATALFGTAATFYSAEGSSQCIRAMLALAVLHAEKRPGKRPVIVAGRNAHKTFLLACALLDVDILWLWPKGEKFSLCRCPIEAADVTKAISSLDAPPAAVYVTSPDYLGEMLDIPALAQAAHARGVPLLVDNAHGAYLRFLSPSPHPMAAGADLCCDSAHKTLPVLTGGAYLHIHRDAARFVPDAKRALALFGSTSPSYLILQSLDLCNRRLAEDYPAALAACVGRLAALRAQLTAAGWRLVASDPLKLTVDASVCGWTGSELAEHLRRGQVECEYADPDYVVLMLTPHSGEEAFSRIAEALGRNERTAAGTREELHMAPPEQVCTVREAIFAPQETIPAQESLGRVLAVPTVGCPPAVPIVVSGERIAQDAITVFERYGIPQVTVMKG